MKVTEDSDVELAIGAKLKAGIVWYIASSLKVRNCRRYRAEDGD